MKPQLACVLALALVPVQSMSAQPMKLVTPSTTHWMPAPPSLPKGAEIAILSGDPSQPGPFAFRIRAPAGYIVALHTHPSAENLTVISGSILHGMSASKSAARTLHAGDFVYLPPHMPHALWGGDRPAVVQINGTGPFEITYVNSADDPRKQ